MCTLAYPWSQCKLSRRQNAVVLHICTKRKFYIFHSSNEKLRSCLETDVQYPSVSRQQISSWNSLSCYNLEKSLGDYLVFSYYLFHPLKWNRRNLWMFWMFLHVGICLLAEEGNMVHHLFSIHTVCISSCQ